MFKNYLKIAFRSLWKQKSYSFINVMGLAIGLACCIVILVYVNHELSYDKHHDKSDRIYRVVSKIDFSGNYLELASAPAPMGPTLKQDFPEVEEFVRFRPRGSYLVRRDDSNIKEEDVVFADASVFSVFSMPMMYGDAESALEEPFSVVISRSMAMKYFGKADVVGESLLLDDEHTFTVTGVMEDMPETSHFHFDFLLSMETIDEADNTTWFSNNFRTYILLKEGTDPQKFEEHFETIKTVYVEPQLKQFMGIGMEEFEAAGNSVVYDLQALPDIHLYSDLTGEFKANGSITYVYIFSGLAAFILLLACINFMNLATARSAGRAKEVGIRKTLGSVKSQLTVQFLLESVLLSLFAFLIALLLVELTLPWFSELSGRALDSSYISNPMLVLVIAAVVVGTGLLAGSYPAFLLSSFRPVRVLKGTFSEKAGHSILRKSLVVFQFTISLVILIGLLVMNKQMDYINNRSLGFEKDQVVIVNGAYAMGGSQRVETYKDQMLEQPIFRSATISSFFPVEGYGRNDMTYWPEGETPTQDNTVNMQTWRVDEHYIPTLQMEIVKGRNFSEERNDQNTVILNEAAAQRFDTENIIGKFIYTYAMQHDGSINEDETVRYEIIGVVKNFNHESLKNNITPLGLFFGASYGNVAFKIAPDRASEALDILESGWKEFASSQPFSYSFMDQRFDQMYRAENRLQELMSAFSFLAVIIACLGLFGLSAYSTERRTREIGIRKVLGADVMNILRLVSGEFLKLIILSFLIAIPISYWVMRQWLQEFAYRTEIGAGVFLIAGIGALLIALLTVSWQSLKAALMNPVDSLKNE